MIYWIVSENICFRPAVYEIYSLYSAMMLKGTTVQFSEAKMRSFHQSKALFSDSAGTLCLQNRFYSYTSNALINKKYIKQTAMH